MTRALPGNPWARPSYLWSPDGRWFAATFIEVIPDDWDEIPVGGPTLENFVAGYEGLSGERLWIHNVPSAFAPFEWAANGLLEAARRFWNPATGKGPRD